ncbi:MAG: hypothetical protein L0215_03950 [Gemmataceae bacterium]|nr:hypothetical protein [Gemmataceae bacterium]
MTVTVHLLPDTEQKLREQAAHYGKSLEEYLSHLAHDWAAANGVIQPESFDKRSAPERAAAWREWVASHDSVTRVADDSRESIYAGRGE